MKIISQKNHMPDLRLVVTSAVVLLVLLVAFVLVGGPTVTNATRSSPTIPPLPPPRATPKATSTSASRRSVSYGTLQGSVLAGRTDLTKPTKVTAFLYVKNNASGDGTFARPFGSIQSALAAAAVHPQAVAVVLLDPVFEISAPLKVGRTNATIVLTGPGRARSFYGCPDDVAGDFLPQISGGKSAKLNFTKQGPVFKAPVTGPVRNLFVNDKRSQRARTGFLMSSSTRDTNGFNTSVRGSGPVEAVFGDQWVANREKTQLTATGRIDVQTNLILPPPRIRILQEGRMPF